MPFFTFEKANVYRKVALTPFEEIILNKNYTLKPKDRYKIYIPVKDQY